MNQKGRQQRKTNQYSIIFEHTIYLLFSAWADERLVVTG
jgi:hypothetical protein